ncbi:MAG: hypothetical protein REI12_11120 [Pedobacter sp.]|nr:hypothetical protein [Pedobacter sp.]
MNAKHTVLALSLLALAGVSQAGDRHEHRGHGDRGPRAEQQQPRESFTEETVRKSADGKVSKRKTEQKVTDNGFSRKSTFTNPEGKTATQEVSASYDKDSKTYTKTAKGTDFDGKSWSRESKGERTADGYKREGEWSNRRGGHGRREVDVSREGNTVSKEVKTTKADGSTTEKSTVKQKP